MSSTSIAAHIGLSQSSCHRRAKELEASGVIEGYRANVSPDRLGLTFAWIVFVTMNMTDRSTVAAFEDAVADEPSIGAEPLVPIR